MTAKNSAMIKDWASTIIASFIAVFVVFYEVSHSDQRDYEKEAKEQRELEATRNTEQKLTRMKVQTMVESMNELKKEFKDFKATASKQWDDRYTNSQAQRDKSLVNNRMDRIEISVDKQSEKLHQIQGVLDRNNLR
ncbi:MAG: hypothetical protein AAF363_15780 [Bacteroidota bacterium]